MNEIKGKYVIAHNGQAILFSNAMVHSDFKGFRPIAAGFFSVYATSETYDTGIGERTEEVLKVSVFGKSTTLNLGPRKEEDVMAIRIQFGVL